MEKQECKENSEENTDGNGNNEMDNVCKKKGDSCTASNTHLWTIVTESHFSYPIGRSKDGGISILDVMVSWQNLLDCMGT